MTAGPLLLDALAMAVPLEIAQLRWAGSDYRAWLAHSAIAEGGDDLLYGGPRCAASFGRLARGLALLAYQPGGVAFGPLHWCAAHPRHEVTGQVCAACLAQPAKAEWVKVAGGVL
jgi:hypothetical protein